MENFKTIVLRHCYVCPEVELSESEGLLLRRHRFLISPIEIYVVSAVELSLED